MFTGGKLTHRELAAMVAMQADPSVPDEAKKLNGLVAAEELSDAEFYFCYVQSVDPVLRLAQIRLDATASPMRDRAARGEHLWKHGRE